MAAFHVSRSTVIQAPPEKAFQTIVDFGTWTTWSPWLSADKNAKVTVSDPGDAVGSVYSWAGELVGQGEIEHQQLDPPRLIEQEIRFLKPFRSVSTVRFEVEPSGEGSKVTWHMNGSPPWFLFWMRSQMEVFIGMDYERGLKLLKEYVETGAVLSKTDIDGVQSIGPLRVLGKRVACSMDDMGSSMDAAMGDVEKEFAKHQVPRDGEMVSVYHKFDFKSRQCEYTSGYAVAGEQAVPAGLVEYRIPQVQALLVHHVGSYDNLGSAWNAGYQYLRYKKLKNNRKVDAFEIYGNSPDDVEPAELQTNIYLPLK